MTTLHELLQQLRRPGVRELVLQSNSPVCVRVERDLVPLAPHPLRTDEVAQFLQEAGIFEQLPPNDTDVTKAAFAVDGGRYVAQLKRFGHRLQVRIAQVGGAAAAPPAPAQPSGGAGTLPSSPLRAERLEAARAAAQRLAPGTDFAGSHRRELLSDLDTPPSSRQPGPDSVSPISILPVEPRLGARPLTGQVPTLRQPLASPPPSSRDSGLPPALGGSFGAPGRESSMPPPAVLGGLDALSHQNRYRGQPTPAPMVPQAEHAHRPELGQRAPSRDSLDSLVPRLPSEAPPLVILSNDEPPAPWSPASQPNLVSPTAVTAPRGAAGPKGRVDTLLALGRSQQASDLIVTSGRPPSLRIHGELIPQGAPISDEELKADLLPLLSPEHRRDLEERGYADFSWTAPTAGRQRVNICRHREGWKGTFRLIANEPQSLQALHLPPELSKITTYHQGLVVIAGPSGQGKSSTLAALVDLLNRTKPVHIITVEDPVEVLHPVHRALITQREVGPHTTSFARALKAALREDPDVIAIGELRDQETVEMALSAAETGHLVIATMSTPSGARAIDRLIDMFPPDDQAQVRATLAGALKFIIGQRLVPAEPTGLVAAVELITGNIPLWALIRENKLYQLPSLLQRGRAFGMIRMEDSLSTLLAEGRITEETARAFAVDQKALVLPNEGPGPLAPPADPPRPPRRGLLGGKG